MKNKICITITILCCYAISFAQNKTPELVTMAFTKKFAAATEVKWDKENAHEYEAEFKWNGASYSANFSDNGEWLETESPFSFDLLPDKVQSAFNTAHKGEKIKEVSKIETLKQGLIYEVEITKGLKTTELFYKADGSETKE